MSMWVIGVAISFYFYLIFRVALWVEHRPAWKPGPLMYALSLAVYCTSWTYYGGIGRAAENGFGFFAVYVGPIVVFLFAQPFLRKLVRVCQAQRISSISDLLSARYGKSAGLAALAAFVALLSLVPYIALQLRSVSDTLALITHFPHEMASSQIRVFWLDPTFWVAMALSFFVIFFGTRGADASEQHRGLVSAVSLESAVKLGVFLLCGWVVVQSFGGLEMLIERAQSRPELSPAWSLKPLQGPDFWLIAVLSGFVIFCLPRQFQVMVVENNHVDHLRTSRWLFPAYLIAINLFVIPLTVAGLLTFAPGQVKADTFMLALPLALDHPGLALAVFIGGLSAGTAMIIVETIALATMVSNDLLMPWLIGRHLMHQGVPRAVARWVKPMRRLTIFGVLLLSYIFVRMVGNSQTLAAIGLMSFVAIAQFAPAIIGGLYWRRGHWRGAAFGLVAGFLIWVYTLLLPTLAQTGWFDPAHLQMEWVWLRPQSLFGFGGLGLVTHSMVVSLLLNTLIYVVVSFWSTAEALDRQQAVLFVREQASREVGPQASRFSNGQLFEELSQFIDPTSLQQARWRLEAQRGGPIDELAAPDAAIQVWAETQLSGVLGVAMARVVLMATLQNDDARESVTRNMLSEAQLAIQGNWDSMRTTLDNIEQGVCMFDDRHQLLVWNRRIFELLALDPELACIGTPITHFLLLQSEVATPLIQLTGSAEGKNGRIIQWHWQHLNKGGVVGTFTDITAQKEAESRLEQKVSERTAEVIRQKAAVEFEHEMVQKAHRNISLLSEIGREITASLDQETIMMSVYNHVHQLMEVDAFAIGIVDSVQGVIGFPLSMDSGVRNPWYCRQLSDPNQFAIWCVTHAKEVFINNLETDFVKYVEPSGIHAFGVPGQKVNSSKSMIFVPLMLKGRVIGVMNVRCVKPFGYESVHLDMMITLAAYTAVALDNAHAYQRVQDLQERLLAQEKMAALGYLVGGIAHELNTPIGNSLMMASSLHEMSENFALQIGEGRVRRADLDSFNDEAKEATAIIIHNLNRVANLVNSFKELSMSQQAAQRLHFNLQQLSLDIVGNMMESIQLHRHHLTLDIPDAIELDSYPTAWGEILAHLINNALLHAYAARSDGQMRLSARQLVLGWVQIQFSDDGAGIEEEHVRRIFDPFFTTRLGSGRNGLGLHIVHNLVTVLLGGQITVQSSLGKGTVFTIDLPLTARV
jgi:Na+/proline symporter/signal transduction histidine kinase